MTHLLLTAWKALAELGPAQVGPFGAFAAYQLRLRSGWLRRQTSPGGQQGRFPATAFALQVVLPIPTRETVEACLGPQGRARLLAEANEIIAGRVRLFGGEPVPLKLVVDGPLDHWTRPWRPEAPPDDPCAADIKFTWEPARFGWAFTLARAYHLTGEERYAAAFWAFTEAFLQANPPNLGPHWASAQEVALRLLALVFAGQVFAPAAASTPERRAALGRAIAEHAQRIPPTLAYARAQNNNHLLTEAAGLYTAGLALPDHPQAAQWRRLGWRWFHTGLRAQVEPDGTYAQHSANYHRLMLQTALWVRAVASEPFPESSRALLAAATQWLLRLLDPATGRVPNLGPNDGANILPLTVCPFADYRPTLQAAARLFLGHAAFPPGAWDEQGEWLRGSDGQPASPAKPSTSAPTPHRLGSRAHSSWAYFRLARFRGRPAHADQLHLDLWWRGLNVAQDAGTYLYNAPPPWENALTHAAVHNTLTVDGQDQMTRAGRFLYLDKAQARLLESEPGENGFRRLKAEHDGFRRLGLAHRREVECQGARWQVRDEVLPAQSGDALPHTARLHWLLPDWPWEWSGNETVIELRLASPHGPIRLRVRPGHPGLALVARLVRAGEPLAGLGAAANQIGPELDRVEPVWGWASPTYGVKIPALSLGIFTRGPLPLTLISEWIFPEDSEAEAST